MGAEDAATGPRLVSKNETEARLETHSPGTYDTNTIPATDHSP